MDESDEMKEQIYKNFSEIAKLQADKIRLENNERPIYEEGINILNNQTEESNLGRLERLKKWAKENLIGLSAISISISVIMTTIIGANALGSLAKALKNMEKKLGSLIAQILTWGAKGIEFLAKNLWLLAIVIAYFVYDQYKERKQRKHKHKNNIFIINK